MNRLSIFLLSILLFIQNADAFELEGFKNIKFGMTLDQILDLGFNCRIICKLSKDHYTFLGRNVPVLVDFNAVHHTDPGAKVVMIKVTYPKSFTNTIKDLNSVFGKESFTTEITYPINTIPALAGKSGVNYTWLASNNEGIISVKYIEGDDDIRETEVEFTSAEILNMEYILDKVHGKSQNDDSKKLDDVIVDPQDY